MIRPRRVAGCCVLLLAACSAAFPAQGADPYPAKPVRMIVPLAPGGPSDTLARILAAKMTEPLGQNVIVDNRPGASGIIGTELVARSPADGYTILLVSNTISINPAVMKKLPYEFDKDLAAVSLLAVTPYVLTVHPSLPVKSVKELIALAKARPKDLNYASGGTGTGPQMAFELMMLQTGIKITHIPYKGTGPALNEMVAGQVQVAMFNLIAAMPVVQAGRLRGIAVSGDKRTSQLPDVPTLAELGIKG